MRDSAVQQEEETAILDLQMNAGHIVIVLIGNASWPDGFDVLGKYPAWEQLKGCGLEIRSWVSRTIGSHSSYELLFGEYPFRNGNLAGFSFWSDATPAAEAKPTLAHAMRQAGRETAMFGKLNVGRLPDRFQPLLGQGNRNAFVAFLHGFQVWNAGIGSNVQPPASTGAPGSAYDDWWRFDDAWGSASASWCDAEIGKAWRDWFDARVPGPSFSVVSFQAAHGPLSNPDGARATVPAGYGLDPSEYTDRETHLLAADYQLSQILGRLDPSTDSVLFFSTTGSGPKSVRDDRILCPAVIAGPGLPAGATSSNIETVRDVWLRFATEHGLPDPVGPDSTGMPYAYCRWDDNSGAQVVAYECVRTKSFKLSKVAGVEELWDLEQDPGELSPIDPDTFPDQSLVAQLREWMANP